MLLAALRARWPSLSPPPSRVDVGERVCVYERAQGNSALSTPTFLSMFLSTAFPQLSFKSFQSLKDFFPLALLTTTIVFRTHSLRKI